MYLKSLEEKEICDLRYLCAYTRLVIRVLDGIGFEKYSRMRPERMVISERKGHVEHPDVMVEEGLFLLLLDIKRFPLRKPYLTPWIKSRSTIILIAGRSQLLT